MAIIGLLFPGQGAQFVGMGQDVAESTASARAVFDRANEVLGWDLARVCFEGPASDLEKTDIQQPAIFTTSVAIWAAFAEAGGRLDQFSFAGGLSLGEYSALHVTGAMGFEEALRLVHRRGQLMQEAAEASPSGMVCLVGADERVAKALCDKASQGEVLVPANFNCPGQVVISGSEAACRRAEQMAGGFECRAIGLPVAGAFHSPLMSSAAEALRPVLQDTAISRPELKVVANASGGYHGDGDAIRESLRRQVDHPVLWQRCVELMIADGVEQFVEIGPGRVLTGLLRKIDRRIKVTNVSNVDSIALATPAVTG